ncbi:phosphate ABC transporter permease subunit PstC [Pseudobacteroides cellulosolvens]|uniref:Phosphate transport system permease protein n=1 Tax=Pseudobacteroides cellulosolvens ATCC 35603 = DSM 2933 TaxID=398512 RepID=A0A0L6JQM0_9FIRM|nr:phosphate ABC transporter permease subunit PstC [Pseudobacteroides cellulosolvens]KNY27662.1 phosphate ABC transporter, inner membrane subunit PstC [Pseudobacteroides cellulosolvens ATCC 35603 = DSM 2933]
MSKHRDNKNKRYFKNELLGKSVVTFFGVFLIILTISLVFFIASQGLSTFIIDKQSPFKFLFSSKWDPLREISKGGPAIGALVFIFGSISVSAIALLISTPFSVAISIFMSEISPNIGRKILQPVIEIFVGIPSVVYGWIGLTVLVPFISKLTLTLPFIDKDINTTGKGLLTGGLVLSIMIFPTIASISYDALKALPRDYKEASFALGATRWQSIRKVLIPAALPGMLTGIVLGLARAFGEALAVQMVIGNNILLPKSIFDRANTMTSVITMEMGNAVTGTLEANALWSLALLLLIISFLFIVIIHKIGAKGSFIK